MSKGSRLPVRALRITGLAHAFGEADLVKYIGAWFCHIRNDKRRSPNPG
jgi:hypothetical protein